jgi:hypothetical protein
MGLDFRERNVRLRQKADILAFKRNARCFPKSGHFWVTEECLLCANSGHCPAGRFKTKR